MIDNDKRSGKRYTVPIILFLVLTAKMAEVQLKRQKISKVDEDNCIICQKDVEDMKTTSTENARS